jgi:putative transposase
MAHCSPTLVLVHAVWATESRKPILEESFDELLIRTFGQKARDTGSSLIAAGCAADHVHVVLRLAPSVPLAALMGRMKGGSAYDISRALAPKRIVWQRGYWAESIGHTSLDAAVRYVQSQRLRHDDSHPAERWQRDTTPSVSS